MHHATRPRSATRPYLRLFLTASTTAAVLALVAGCGGVKETSATTTTVRRTTTTSPELTTSEVERLLLVVKDLPPGWKDAPADDAAEPGGEEGGEDSEAGIFCPAAAAPMRQEEHQSAAADFSRSSMGPEFSQALLSAPDPAAHFADTKRVVASCVGQTWTMDADGETMTMSMAETPAPDVGDRAAAFRVTGKGAEGTTLTVDVVLVLRGSVDQAYFGAAFSAPGVDAPEFGEDEFRSMVVSGDRKVAETTDGGA